MLFVATISINALLLFLLEPMFAKIALPHFGGTAAVWTTCVLFFQLALVAGYLYAHGLSRLPRIRDQVGIHVGLALLAALTLPVGIPSAWSPPAGERPELALLGVLFRRLGAAFVVLSAGSPLLQHWAAGMRQADDKDPFSLYVASNVGSFVALLAYPTVIEPHWTLHTQSIGWAIAYVALITLLFASGVLSGRWSVASSNVPPPKSHDVVSTTDRIRWLILAAAPSSLLLGVTTHITTDLAAIPLLWVVPLALYLATFVVAFSEWGRRRVAKVDPTIPYLAIAVASLLFLRAELPGRAGYAVHVVAFFAIALACHCKLAASRPRASRLTEFYLWMSIGGALGAAFNVLIAPNVFDTVVEYPVVLLVAVFLARPNRVAWRVSDLLIPLALGAVLWIATESEALQALLAERQAASVAVAIGGIVAFTGRNRPIRFVLSLSAMLIVGYQIGSRNATSLLRARSFYGVYEVVVDDSARMRELYSGTTIHGAQFLSDSGVTPLTYYHRDGPLGALFSSMEISGRGLRVGVVGLGVGSAAAYSRAGDRWTFFEIDPLVVQIATDTNYFRFLSSARSKPSIVIGDGRLSIERDTEARFDLLVIDAFSSDAIPVHLITREAVALYVRRLGPNGVIAWHVSNRYLDLRPILRALAADANVTALLYTAPQTGVLPGRFPANWAVMTGSSSVADALQASGKWSPLKKQKGDPLWTDDFSNILSVLR